MNFSKFKSFFYSSFIYIVSFIFIFSSGAQAADIQAQLDSNDGSSGFTIESSTGAGKTRIDSNGNVGIGTTGPSQTLLYVSPSGLTPTYPVGAGDAYIENNLEVDGTAYLNDVFINGLQVNGGTFKGGSSIDTLAVTGNTYLATTAGSNVGIGTVSAGSLFAVGLLPSSQFLVNSSGAITAVASISTTGAYTQSGAGVNTLSGKTEFTAAGTSASFTGNVGIGTTLPGTALDVLGQLRTANFTMTGQTPISGYVLTASDSSGDATWSSAGGVAGWTVAGNNVYQTNYGNVGIGTSTAQGALVVTNGNVGIGTWSPSAPLTVGAGAMTVNSTGLITTSGGIAASNSYTQNGTSPNIFTGVSTFNNPANSALFTGGNVGIATSAPGATLDVLGTVRVVNFTMSGQTPVSGFVLTAADSSGDATWSSAGGVAGWTVSGPNVYETSSGNVGIGTSTVSQGSLVVTNGNVGIGTWAPSAPLTVGANALTVSGTGVLTTTGGIVTSNAYTQSGTSPNTFTGTSTFNNPVASAVFTNGNVGISTTAPGATLDVQGSIRTTNFTMSGQTPVSGFVLTAADSNGDTTWSSAGGVAGWTVSGPNVYETSSGNVGIGTTTVNQGALLVTNGNVGIGTWAPSELFAVGNNAFTVSNNGAVANVSGYTQTGASPNTFSGTSTFSNNNSAVFNGNVGFGTTTPQAALAITGGNVGIGTWSAAGGNLIVNGGGNVGINTAFPGVALDVAGSVRVTNLTMTGQTPISGFVLTASDSNGDMTWSSAGGVAGWTVSGNNVYETNLGNVGIGTATVNQGALVVTNGNVGIGTWAPGQLLDVTGTVRSTAFTTNGAYTQSGTSANILSGTTTFTNANSAVFNGNVGFGTTTPQAALAITGGNVGIGTWSAAGGNLIVNGGGNVGINTAFPGVALDVAGSVRVTNLTMTGQTPISGFVLTASDSNGDMTWSSAGGVAGWTVSGNNVYETNLGNVGIGTATVNQGALVVTNGNVGIGTWAPGQLLDVTGTVRSTAFTTNGAYTQSGTSANILSGTTTFTNANSAVFNGNVGFGTTTPQAALAITGGNVGIGTWSAAGGNLIVNGGGNVGINTAFPGMALDVSGTIRTTNFTMSGQTPIQGYVLEAADSNGDASWASLSTISGWSLTGNNLYVTNFGNVGIGTATVSQGALIVTNGNVGIGTWAPGQLLDVIGTVRSAAFTTNGAYTQSGTSANTFTGTATFNNPANSALFTGGNVGVGTVVPGVSLDVQGTVRAVGFTMSGQTPVSGYVLTASDSSGDVTWSSAGGVAGWTVSGSNVYETSNGNVGIGTATVNQGSLLVTNGNVGIGTWSPSSLFQVNSPSTSPVAISSSGNVGIGTTANQTALAITNGNVGIGTWTAGGGNLIIKGGGNVGIGSAWPGQTLDVSGNVRNTGEIVNGNVGIGTSASQAALAVSNGNVGIGTWSPSTLFQVNSPTNAPFAVTSTGNVGIGTTSNQAALAVTNGNVGIGTWAPRGALDITGGANILVERGNVGVGTTTPQANFVAMGNVGIGTWTAAGGNLIVNGGGNVGVGSAWPGTALDVNGSVRSTGFTMSGQTPISGYVLTASDSAGDTTWSSAGGVAGWTVSGNNVYETSNGNVGIGTTTVSQGALVVTNGNVGIGTWTPNALFQVNSPTTTPFTISGSGNVGIGTTANQSGLSVMNGNVGIGTWAAVRQLTVVGDTFHNGNVGVGTSTTTQGAMVVTNGNVGIGTWSPAALFQINSPTTTPFTISGSGNVGIGTTVNQSGLSVMNGNVGIGTWTAGGGNLIIKGGGNVGIGSAWPGQTLDVSGNVRNTGEIVNGNVGIGTSASQAALAVSNGNVGIGTWSPNALFQVNSPTTTPFTISSSGNVGIGTTVNQSGLSVMNGNVGIGTWTAGGGNLIIKGGGNVGIGSAWPGQTLDVSGNVRSTGDIVNGNVGIGTSASQAALAVSNGNVGIGTWSPNALFQVNSPTTTPFTISGSGNVGIGTTVNQSGLSVMNGNVGIGTWTAGGGNLIINGGGNVGIGTAWPGTALDVNGSIRATHFVGDGSYLTGISGAITGLTSGYVPKSTGGTTIANGTMYDSGSGIGIGTTTPQSAGLVVTNGNVGIGTWTGLTLFQINQPSGNPFTVSGNGNVGVGTTTAQGALVVTGGNVGIGTWSPSMIFQVNSPTTTPFTISGSGNVGIGTTANQSGLSVMNGNVGIGTWTAGGGNLIIKGGGNVGIGSAWPGQTLDVSGNVRNTGEIVNGNVGIGTSASQAALAVSNGNVGIGTWSPSTLFQVNSPTNAPFAVTSTGNVGIGTTSNQAALAVTNGNVGIGTWAPRGALDITGGANILVERGNVGVGTTTPQANFVAMGNVGIGTWTAAGGNLIVNGGGNVGVGSAWPGTALDVNGSVRSTGFTMSGQTPISGYVLTASDSAGDTTWSSAGGVAGWTVSGNNVYETSNGNVGIGTTTVSQGALVVTNGNVGIGTWTPNALFQVNSPTTTPFTISGSGNVGIGTTSNQSGLSVMNGNVGIGTWTAGGGNLIINGGGNVGIGTAWPGTALDVNGSIRATHFVGDGSYLTGISGAITGLTSGYVPKSTGGTTIANGTMYDSGSGIGIGTTTPQSAGLVVTNGNVGIGTWSPSMIFQVNSPTTTPFTISGSGNVGLGTTANQSGLSVMNGNVGIGTWTAGGGNLIIKGGGNVGIGSAWPGQTLDVSGNVRNTGEIVNGNVGIGTSASQAALAVSNGNVGIGTWSPSTLFQVNSPTNAPFAVTSTGNVGIGTTSNQAALAVTNGNVGIGTWAPRGALDITGGANILVERGNVGVGTTTPQANFVAMGNVGIGTWTAAGGNLIVNGGGNVGVGSAWPGTALDVNGSVRSTGFTMSGQTPISGYVLTASDSAGDTTWSSAGGVAGWTVSGNNVYETSNGNVGIGTTTLSQGALVVTNGNVGIGTWTPNALFQVNSPTTTPFTISGSGNVGIGTTANQSGLSVMNGNVGIGTWTPNALFQVNSPTTTPFTISGSGNVGIGTTVNQSGLSVMNGNVGIGTWTAGGGNLIINGGGNVGIATAWPGTALDVNGSIRATHFVGDGSYLTGISGAITGLTSGYVPKSTGSTTIANGTIFDTGTSVGIGTTTPQSAGLVVTNGNVGIGTWATAGGSLIIKAAGNVGIGSAWPGAALDVNGSVRSTGFTMSGQTPISGYVLTASDSAGDTTWSSAGGVAGWTVSGNNVYETSNGNVGIGTTTVSQGALVVTNGNVGIGTWAPNAPLAIYSSGTNFATYTTPAGSSEAYYTMTVAGDGYVGTYGYLASLHYSYINPGLEIQNLSGNTTDIFNNTNGNVGIGTSTPQQAGLVVTNGNVGIGTWTAGGGALIVSSGLGNVGIGSAWPGAALDVNGSVRSTGFTMSGQTPISGYVLTASDSAGDTTWSSAGGVSGWTVSGNNVYETSNGNVGIGTTTVSQGALVVTNGNVGIGTWSPNALFQVNNPTTTPFTISSSGNVGIGTTVNQSGLSVMNGNVGIGTWTAGGGNLIIKGGGNVGIGSAWPGQTLDVSGNVRSTGEIVNGNVGIGTSASQAALAVSNGNVGIGTWTPNALFQVNSPTTTPFTISGSGNVGIGTTVNQSGLSVMNGNVGIGTWTAGGGNLIINGGGNVGIATAWPGTALDVNGSIRATHFVGDGSYLTGISGAITGLTSGYVPKSTGSTTIANGTIFDTGTSVGIGTTTPQSAGLVVTNGNVGIGTWATAGGSLIIKAAGNVGIGSAWPGAALDVNGSVRSTGFTMSGQTPISGYVLTASDSAGDTTWSSAGGVAGWTVSGNNVYETSNGNVGIGTTTVSQGALVVTNGNVGIGTWTPNALFQVNSPKNSAFTISSTGNVGIGTSANQAGLSVMNGNVGIGTWASTAELEVTPSGSNPDYVFDVDSIFGQGALTVDYNGNTYVEALHPGEGGMQIIYSGAFNNSVIDTSSGGGNLYLSSDTNQNIILFPGSAGGISSTANVGIGTTSPLGILDVEGTLAPVVINAEPAASTYNVGIGSFSPGQKLDVHGTIRDLGEVLTSNVPATTTNELYNNSGTLYFNGSAVAGAASQWLTNAGVGIGTYSNVGIGTTNPQAAFTVTNGNVGIGTWTAAGGNLIINGGGNVGIATAWPGTALDVNGSIRATHFVGDGSYLTGISGAITGLTSGYVPKSTGSTTIANGTIFDTGTSVGIGTTTPQSAGLVVTNGNVGIGTWATAGGSLIIKAAGNVGIGSAWPGAALDVNGSVRSTGFTMSGQTPISGYVLTASDSAGDTTWSSAGGVAGWTVSGNNVYETSNGNVGIGTTTVSQGALVVTNGNVGIGTWTPNALFQVNSPKNSAFTISSTGNVGIGTSANQAGLSIMNGNVGIGTWAPGASLQVNGTLNQFVVSTSGNVGIGTTVPGAYILAAGNTGQFTVDASGYIIGQSLFVHGYVEAAGALFSYYNDATPYVSSSSTQSYLGNSGAVLSGSNGDGVDYEVGDIALGANNSSANLQSLYIGAVANPGASNYVPTIVIDQQTGKNSYSERLRIDQMGNMGIGTVSPLGILDVEGTQAPIVLNAEPAASTYNVGIGSFIPGQKLDVQGTIRALGEVLTSNVPATTTNELYNNSGTLYFNGSAVAGAASQWLTNAGVGIGTYGNVGIGTTNPQAAFTVTNGNVGIGTWTAAGGNLIIKGGGNVGIGSAWPGAALDVNGSVRSTGFTMSGQTPISGYVLTASDSAGDTTWSSAGGVSGWTVSGNNVYETSNGNVGIGTTTVSQGALVVTNGNVGIGTWAPAALLDVQGTLQHLYVAANGNVGIGTWVPQSSFVVNLGSNPSGGELAQFIAPTYGGTAALNISGQYAGEIYLGQVYDNHNWILGGYIGGGKEDIILNGDMGFEVQDAAGQVARFGQSETDLTSYFNGNLGIGTTTPQTRLTVIGGNVGIGTWTAGGALIVSSGVGNVGIGSAWPGTLLDVQGTIRDLGEVLTSNVPATTTNELYNNSGTLYFNGSAVAGAASQWLTNAGVGIGTYSNVGIGTTNSQGALVVTSGNVGIGTWIPSTLLDVKGTLQHFYVAPNGYVGVGTSVPYAVFSVGSTSQFWVSSNGTVSSGSIGSGGTVSATQTDTTVYKPTGTSAYPGSQYWVSDNNASTNGVITTMLLQGQNSSSNAQQAYFGAVSNTGAGVYTPTIVIGQQTGNSTYAERMRIDQNGNVGIGTISPLGILDVEGTQAPIVLNAEPAASTYNVGIGSFIPGQKLDVQGTIRDLGEVLTSNVPATTTNELYNNSGTLYFNGSAVAGAASQWLTNAGVGIGTYNNVGIGTTTPQGAFVVTNGNVGIGTWAPGALLQVGGVGNVGIGSTNPGQPLDVAGAIRGQQVIDTGVTASNLVYANTNNQLAAVTLGGSLTLTGGTLADSATGLNYWSLTAAAGNVGISTTNSVGIGTTNGGTGTQLVVMGGNVGIGTWAPSSMLSIKGSMAVNVVSKTANYTATVQDNVILVSASGGAVTITIPAAATVTGREYVIKKTDSSANAVTITDSTDNIDGQASVAISSQYQSLTIVSDGTNWDIV